MKKKEDSELLHQLACAIYIDFYGLYNDSLFLIKSCPTLGRGKRALKWI